MKKSVLLTLALFLLATTGFFSCEKGDDDNNPNKIPEPTVIGSGTIGPLTWKLTEDGALTISGKGAMPDTRSPWFDSKIISTITIDEGVTHIGKLAFLTVPA